MAKTEHKGEQVAVIGAGMAGLSCAAALRAAGVSVQVFEKSRGPSGRMSTRRGEGWQCDHGAQYFTARDPRFQAQVGQWVAAGVASRWAPRVAVLPPGTRATEATEVARYVGTPRMTSPAAAMVAALEAASPRPVPVHVGTTVQALEKTPEGWRLRSAEQGWHPEAFRAVLLAIPAPQVLPLVQAHSAPLHTLAASACMRGAWALMLRYGRPVALPFDAAFVNEGPLRWVARDSHKPGRSGPETWSLHATATWSEDHLEETPEQVGEALLAAFAQWGGPAPDAWTAHRWRHADTQPHLAVGCAWEAADGLGLCGDWLATGKVEGAWLSGAGLAERVVAVP